MTTYEIHTDDGDHYSLRVCHPSGDYEDIGLYSSEDYARLAKQEHIDTGEKLTNQEVAAIAKQFNVTSRGGKLGGWL